MSDPGITRLRAIDKLTGKMIVGSLLAKILTAHSITMWGPKLYE